MLPLMQVAGVGGRQQGAERTVGRATVKRIDLIDIERQNRIGAQMGRDLSGLGFVNAQLPRQQSGVALLKTQSDMLPGESLLGRSAGGYRHYPCPYPQPRGQPEMVELEHHALPAHRESGSPQCA